MVTGQDGGLTFVRRAARVLFNEVRAARRHRAGCLKARRYADATGLQLNLGCGPKRKAGWVNIDFARHADLSLDLRQPLPFSDRSCARVYSEHFFEHLDYPEDAYRHLREAFRVLAPGGELSFGVPDAEGPLVWYAQTRGHSPAQAEEECAAGWPGHPKWVQTPMEKVNFLFRQNYHYAVHQHRYAYDFQTLERALRAVGFAQVSTRDFDPELDTADRRAGTLYLRAEKPGH